MDAASGLTFLIVCCLQELGAEKRAWKLALPSFNDQRLPLLDDLVPNELLELKFSNLGGGNALGQLEVGGSVDEAMQIEIRRDRVELGLGMSSDRHVEELEGLASRLRGGLRVRRPLRSTAQSDDTRRDSLPAAPHSTHFRRAWLV